MHSLLSKGVISLSLQYKLVKISDKRAMTLVTNQELGQWWRQKIKNLIGQMRKNKRAARAARTLELFDVVLFKTTKIATFAKLITNCASNLLLFNPVYLIQRRAYFYSYSALHQHYRMRTRWDNRKIITVTTAQMFAFKWRFPWRSRRHC